MTDTGPRDDGVKHLTTENWLEPDAIPSMYVEVHAQTGERRAASGTAWAERFLAVTLAPSAPIEVHEMWEVAQGILCYGWFYYPLYAIGEHQLRRIADAAILHRYQQAGGPPNKKPDPEDGQPTWPPFKRRVDWLLAQGIIPEQKRARWDVIRELRNETTHASIRHIEPPTESLRVLELLADEISTLFDSLLPEPAPNCSS
ncbi:MAG TPA: hypothetical protein VFV03_09150 [Solirubrobacteraceae bacterium]|nr:hypothetical protein [Solirubrobacteraceae bacterium]